MEKINITDAEFIESFQSFTRKARASVSNQLCLLIDDDRLGSGDRLAGSLSIIENYYFMTETVLMKLEAFNDKKNNPNHSLASIYSKVFVKERINGKDGQVTEEMLKVISELNNKELMNYLELKTGEEIFSQSEQKVQEELMRMFGSKEKAFEQGERELDNLRDAIIKILYNRMPTIEETKVPLYKVLNKLKHGYQIYPNKDQNMIHILIDVIDVKENETVFGCIGIPFSIESANFFADQTKIMSDSLNHLLMIYSANL